MDYILIPLIVFVGLLLKGITGTGTSTVVVAFSALLIDPKLAIVLAALINIPGGLMMIKLDPVPLNWKFWAPVAAVMTVGSVNGAWLLKVIDAEIFEVILGLCFLAIALRFLFAKNLDTTSQQSSSPDGASALDLGVGGFAGLCGGFIGINAPVLIAHFGRTLDKRHMRRLLVLIFIPSAFAQVAAFSAYGMVSRELIFYTLISLPAMAAGIYVGNHVFHRVPEIWFRRILGVFLLVVSAKLIF